MSIGITGWAKSKNEKHERTSRILQEVRRNKEECRVFDLDAFRKSKKLVQIETPKIVDDDTENEDSISTFE